MNHGEKLIVVQSGAIKYIGILNTLDMGSSTDTEVRLKNVGQVVTQRQAMPGQITGTVVMAKSVTIVSLDFCKGPTKNVTARVDARYEVDTDHMTEDDTKVFHEAYNKFLEGGEVA